MIKYSVDGTDLEVSEVLFEPIEFLDLGVLNCRCFGVGQIQIANSNHIQTVPQNSRKDWMLQLCDVMMAFYRER